MQAILIATGEENKLQPLTADMPSPMLPIVDRPVIVYAIELLARAGFREIFISLQEQASQIESYLGNGERWNVNLRYLLQREACGSAGALKRAADLLTDTVLVLPADTLVDLDIQAALAYHNAHGGLATAILSQSATYPLAAEQLTRISADGYVQAVEPTAPESATYAYTGGFLFEPATLRYIPAKTTVDCHTQLMAALQQAGQPAHAYVMDGYWNPLATFSDFQLAQQAVLKSLSRPKTRMQLDATTLRYPYVEAGEMQPGIWVGPNSIIHPSARLTAPLFIGAGSRIGRDVELGPNTVIGAGVVIDNGVTAQQSTVLPHTYVGQFLHLADRVAHQSELIDVQTGVNIQITDPWLLSAADPAMSGHLLRNIAERVLALGVLIVSAPFMLCISLAIWLTTGGPVMTRVQRVGRVPLSKGRMNLAQPQLIELDHFRTRNRDNQPTKVGKGLEWGEFNRLPELWNVLCGDIRLVGVKPLTVESTASLHEAWQQRRFDAPIGFTGLWYTQAQPTTDLDELCVMDAYQATTHTWRDDFRQLLLTPTAWVRRLQVAQQTTLQPMAQMVASQTEPLVRLAHQAAEKKQINLVTPSEEMTHPVFSASDFAHQTDGTSRNAIAQAKCHSEE